MHPIFVDPTGSIPVSLPNPSTKQNKEIRRRCIPSHQMKLWKVLTEFLREARRILIIPKKETFQEYVPIIPKRTDLKKQ